MRNDDEQDARNRNMNRRGFLRKAGALGLAGLAGGQALKAVADSDTPRVITAPDQPNPPIITQNFPVAGNDERPIVQYPEKRPLIRVTSRPPQLETPMTMIADGEADTLTANDAFFVRYHNSEIPLSIDPETFRLDVKVHMGAAPYVPADAATGTDASLTTLALTLSLDDLQDQFEEFSIVAVNQCSGNSRGEENPRLPGGQLANGAVGCARWTGVRLKDVLTKAGISATAQQVLFNGLDREDDEPPDFIKALPVARAMDGEVMLAYAMNGEELPMLNGYPLRVVVPGWFGTYHVKHLNEIIISESSDLSKLFYMGTAYRIPAGPDVNVDPVTIDGVPYAAGAYTYPAGYTQPGKATTHATTPITRLKLRSFITSHTDGALVRTGHKVKVKGIAFDGGDGIKMVEFSSDGGTTWNKAMLGPDLGKYAFRAWTIRFIPAADGAYNLKVRATSNSGETQPTDVAMNWNQSGYMRNVVETVKVTAVSSIGDSDD
jgi:DMSO/TMAO reductase YedYZ molybdopterin-dependent catalytic subunit